MFLTIKKRIVICAVCLILCLGGFFIYFGMTRETTSPSTEYGIVIDAGHGGDDGGAVGKSGVSESYLNLQYAKELQTLCVKAGFDVVMTRKDMNGLYSPLAGNKKRSEMQKRESIINGSDARLVVSLHMNSFPLPSSSGAQVFYKSGNESGRALAESIQKSFIEELPRYRKSVLPGDYYVLNCTEKTAVLVECGFLSNEEEEKDLCDENYRKKFCEILLRGILNFYDM